MYVYVKKEYTCLYEVRRVNGREMGMEEISKIDM